MGGLVQAVAWVKDGGAEYAHVRFEGTRLTATGLAIGADPEPYRLEYDLATGDDYVTRRLRVTTAGAGWRRSLDLVRHDGGSWSCTAQAEGALGGPLPGPEPGELDELGEPGEPGELRGLKGALDCDLGMSPLTNTMPVLRHRLLDGGGPVELTMAWVSVPHLRVDLSVQRYAPLGANVLHFEADGSFTADITFASDAFVADYPGVARRL
ncbi:putative glycolipid-binding domain-containing protein [Nonomuraea candida]|uniref:putative glycolipid-binding domain-containing protein n=1 Tax=Nonomuraea candida TaxID=359159 RepID=UPI003F6E3093